MSHTKLLFQQSDQWQTSIWEAAEQKLHTSSLRRVKFPNTHTKHTLWETLRQLQPALSVIGKQRFTCKEHVTALICIYL